MRGVSRTLVFSAAVLGLAFASPAFAKARYESAYTTDNRDTRAERGVFSPDTAKVYVVYMVSDVPKGSKMRAIWFAEKVEGVKDNTQIVTAEASSAGGMQMGLFSYGKPGSGWPAGTYRVDLYIDDKIEKQLRFKVSRP